MNHSLIESPTIRGNFGSSGIPKSVIFGCSQLLSETFGRSVFLLSETLQFQLLISPVLSPITLQRG